MGISSKYQPNINHLGNFWVILVTFGDLWWAWNFDGLLMILIHQNCWDFQWETARLFSCLCWNCCVLCPALRKCRCLAHFATKDIERHGNHFKSIQVSERLEIFIIFWFPKQRERESNWLCNFFWPGGARRKPRGFQVSLCLCCSHGDLGRGQLSKVWLRSMGCRFHCSIAWRSDAEWFFNVLHVFGKLFHFPAWLAYAGWYEGLYVRVTSQKIWCKMDPTREHLVSCKLWRLLGNIAVALVCLWKVALQKAEPQNKEYPLVNWHSWLEITMCWWKSWLTLFSDKTIL